MLLSPRLVRRRRNWLFRYLMAVEDELKIILAICYVHFEILQRLYISYHSLAR